MPQEICTFAFASAFAFALATALDDTDVAQNGAGLVEKGLPDCYFCLKKQGSQCSTMRPLLGGANSIEVGTKLAQNGADLVQHGIKMVPKFVPAIELLEYGFPVSSPSGDEPSGACASSAASSSNT